MVIQIKQWNQKPKRIKELISAYENYKVKNFTKFVFQRYKQDTIEELYRERLANWLN